MRTFLGILIVVALLPRCVSAEDPVGAVGWVERIDFHGATAFTAQELREGLTADLDYLAAAQPHAPRGEFLVTLAGRIREGFRHHGFPDADAIADVSNDAHRVVVRITEGPRYRSGQVMVRGGRTIDQAAIERAFTEPWFGPDSIPVTTLTSDGLQVHWEYISGNPASPNAPLWVPGQPVAASAFDLTQFHDRAKVALAAQGFLFSKFRVFLHSAPQAQSATLVIEIDEQGPPIVFGRLVVQGETRESPDDVTRFLGLRRGQKLDHRIEHDAIHQLWHSGRFHSVRASLQRMEAKRASSQKTADLPTVSNDSEKKKEATQARASDDSAPLSLETSFTALSDSDSKATDAPASTSKKTEGTASEPGADALDPDRPVSVLLQVTLQDAGNLPPLRSELTPSDRAMLNFCHWLQRWPGNDEPDIVIAGHAQCWGLVEHELFRFQNRGWSVPLPRPDFHWRGNVVLSSGRRQFVRVQNSVMNQGERFAQAAIFHPDGVDWRFLLQKSRVQLPWDDRRAFIGKLRLTSTTQNPDPSRFPSTMLDYRIRAARVGGSLTPPDSGLHPGLSVDPFLALLYLRMEGVTHSVSDGLLRVSGPNLTFEIDVESGRLRRAGFVTWNGTATVGLWTERGALEKAIAELEDEVGPFTDRFDPADPWGSICECLRWEFSPLGHFSAEPTWPLAAAALHVLRQYEPRRIIELFDLTETTARTFSIPAPEERIGISTFGARRGGDAAALILRYLSSSDDLRALAVDTVLQTARGDRYIPREIAAIARSSTTGPLTRLAALNLLTDKQTEIRRRAAARQRAELSRPALLEELRQWDERGILPHEDLERLVEALGELSPSECQALAAQVFSREFAPAVVSALAPLRKDRTRPIRELLPEVFDRLWTGGLEREIVQRLESWSGPVDQVITAETADERNALFPVAPASFSQAASSADEFFPDDLSDLPGDETPSTDTELELPPEPTTNQER